MQAGQAAVKTFVQVRLACLKLGMQIGCIKGSPPQVEVQHIDSVGTLDSAPACPPAAQRVLHICLAGVALAQTQSRRRPVAAGVLSGIQH